MKRALLVLFAVALATVGAAVADAQSTGAAVPTPPVAVPSPSAIPDESAGDSRAGIGSSAAGATTPDAAEAERLRVWNSPQMVEARKWVTDYGRHSVRFNAQAAELYLSRLSQQSAPQMRAWLQRYEARQKSLERSATVERAARQTAVDEALTRLQRAQRSYENFNIGQTQGALVVRERLAEQQAIAGELGVARQAERVARLEQLYADQYGWIVNPPLYVQVRAAASLPGDLPAGDPRNFVRGDVPVPGDPGSAAVGPAGLPALGGGAGANAGPGAAAAAGAGAEAAAGGAAAAR